MTVLVCEPSTHESICALRSSQRTPSEGSSAREIASSVFVRYDTDRLGDALGSAWREALERQVQSKMYVASQRRPRSPPVLWWHRNSAYTESRSATLQPRSWIRGAIKRAAGVKK